MSRKKRKKKRTLSVAFLWIFSAFQDNVTCLQKGFMTKHQKGNTKKAKNFCFAAFLFSSISVTITTTKAFFQDGTPFGKGFRRS